MGDETYSIITDYLGTPIEMYDAKGERTWAADYDIYGKIRKQQVGVASDCPFRYPGQYEDTETGLYYNRFRYYAPEEGMYVSQDPIGLAGGMVAYGYVRDVNSGMDVWGLSAVLMNPNNINYSQRTINKDVWERINNWDWNKYEPIHVMEVNGQYVSYDNRRLFATQMLGFDNIPVIIVDPNDPFPDSKTSKTWAEQFEKRFNDKRNKKAGGVVPKEGLKEKPICV